MKRKADKADQLTRAWREAREEAIRKWLKQVRDSTTVNGGPVQPLSSHSYRRSLAMRYLASGSTFENIAMVLGDEIGTLEKHYAELVPNDSQRLAFEKAFRKSAWISSEGTAQPEWLKRPRGSNSNRAMWSSPRTRGSDSTWVVDAGGFEPPAFWLQTRRSSS